METKKYTKRDKIKLVKEINRCEPALHEQLFRTIINYENNSGNKIAYDSNTTKTLIDFSKLNNNLIGQIENLYNTYISNLQYLKDTDTQYNQAKDDVNIVLSKSPPTAK